MFSPSLLVHPSSRCCFAMLLHVPKIKFCDNNYIQMKSLLASSSDEKLFETHVLNASKFTVYFEIRSKLIIPLASVLLSLNVHANRLALQWACTGQSTRPVSWEEPISWALSFHGFRCVGDLARHPKRSKSASQKQFTLRCEIPDCRCWTEKQKIDSERPCFMYDPRGTLDVIDFLIIEPKTKRRMIVFVLLFLCNTHVRST